MAACDQATLDLQLQMIIDSMLSSEAATVGWHHSSSAAAPAVPPAAPPQACSAQEQQQQTHSSNTFQPLTLPSPNAACSVGTAPAGTDNISTSSQGTPVAAPPAKHGLQAEAVAADADASAGAATDGGSGARGSSLTGFTAEGDRMAVKRKLANRLSQRRVRTKKKDDAQQAQLEAASLAAENAQLQQKLSAMGSSHAAALTSLADVTTKWQASVGKNALLNQECHIMKEQLVALEQQLALLQRERMHYWHLLQQQQQQQQQLFQMADRAAEQQAHIVSSCSLVSSAPFR